MLYKKLLYSGLIILLLTMAGLYGCIKDYSYEGGRDNNIPKPVDTMALNDTSYHPDVPFATCASCNENKSLSIMQWSFKNEKAFLCGSVTGAVITPERNAFTFFGPSACSNDTGIIITAYFTNTALTRDQKDISPERVSFEYYDNTTSSKILSSWLPHPFILTIKEYKHSNHTATGTFSGYAYTDGGDSTLIRSGNFQIQFK